MTKGNFMTASMITDLTGDNNTVIDGYVKGCRARGATIVPLHHCHGASSKQPTRETHERLKETILAPLRAALPVDGVLIDLHGGYSVIGLDDGDGDIMKDLRALVGPNVPIMTVHDPHCNLGRDMIDNATAVIIMDTYPHIDMAERALEATDLMVRTIKGEIKPAMAWCSLPLFWAAKKMINTEMPIR